MVWSEQGRKAHSAWAGVHSEVFTGDLAVTRTESLHPALGTRVLLISRVQDSPGPLYFVPVVLQPAKGACLLYVGPQVWEAPSVTPTAYFPGQVSAPVISLQIPSWGTGSDLITFLSFLPNFMCIFLITLYRLYRNPQPV